MSSIRLFILGSLAQRGPMHGHAVINLAEEEHIDMWADFAPSAVYGAIKRLAAEGLIVEDRVEKQGNYPARQVFRISESGARALDGLRLEGLREIVVKPDPFDLALARLDPDRLDLLGDEIADRLARLRSAREEKLANLERITEYLTVAELWNMQHQLSRWESEIDFHERLLAALPEIISDELSRKDQPHD